MIAEYKHSFLGKNTIIAFKVADAKSYHYHKEELSDLEIIAFKVAVYKL
jgi:hypothetical protein